MYLFIYNTNRETKPTYKTRQNNSLFTSWLSNKIQLKFFQLNFTTLAPYSVSQNPGDDLSTQVVEV